MLKKKVAMAKKSKKKVPSVTAAAVRKMLETRIAAVAGERDLLRELSDDCIDLSETCDEAVEQMRQAVEVLSKYV